MSLPGVGGKERNLTLLGVEREKPLKGPGMDGIHRFLDTRSGFWDRGEGGPDSEVIGIEGKAHRRREGIWEVINKEEEEDGTKNRALRNTVTESK